MKKSDITRTLAAITAAAVIALAAHDLFAWVLPVQASTPTVPDVCELVAKAGDIAIYYCEPDNGPPFYINSVGFMALDQ